MFLHGNSQRRIVVRQQKTTRRRSIKYVLAGLIAPLFWLIVLSTALWLTRKFWPSAESWLFAPLSQTIARAWRALTTGRPQ